MRPDCGDECPGPDVAEQGGDAGNEEIVDERLAALASLLGEDPNQD